MTITKADFEREQMARRNAEGKAEAARAEVVRLRGKVAKLEMGEPQLERRMADLASKLSQAETALKRVTVSLEEAKTQRDTFKAQVAELKSELAARPDVDQKLARLRGNLDATEKKLGRVQSHLADTKAQLESYRAQLAEQRAGYTELLQQSKARHMQDVKRLESIIAGLPSEGDVQDAEERAAFAEARLRERPDVVELARLRAEVDKLKREAKVE